MKDSPCWTNFIVTCKFPQLHPVVDASHTTP